MDADCIIIMGSNMAEAHPVGFQWVMEAKARGTRVIHIDPRFTRTSAVADTYVRLRAGSDIAFLGGVVRHVLENDLAFREYVAAYTNASYLLTEDYVDAEDNDGVFSGYDAETGSYDTHSWRFQTDGTGEPVADPTLEHPRCVFQVLRRHYARYTPETVQRVCGVSPEQFADVCEAWTANSGRDRTTSLVYSVGWTQHSVGAQYIRCGAILQLLLGNVGRPGGGIFALRGHASIQGSTDIPTLFNLLPGYLPMPSVGQADTGTYVEALRAKGRKGFGWNSDAYLVSMLKEWFGDAATPENDFGYDWLPRIDGDHGTYRTVMDMIDGHVFGYFVLGQNPAVGSAHGKMQRLGMANLEWMVVRDLVDIETASFWKDSPEIETGEIVTEECRTEVFLLPAASHVEKDGTFTQTQRMVQWRTKAVEPSGDRRSDLWFAYHLGRLVRERLAGSTDPRDLPVRNLAWDYELEGDGEWAEPSPDDVLRRINGYDLATGELLDGFAGLKADGSTSSGCWIYSGVYAGGINRAARREPHHGTPDETPDWGWTWPMNRRVIYNRASADPQGRPWSERKKLLWWDDDAGRWAGHDVPDFVATTPPGHEPGPDTVGPDALGGDDAFVMQPDGKAWLFAPTGVADGPLPTHYEPHESPIRNELYLQRSNPTRRVFGRKDNPSNPAADEKGWEVFPFVLTTSRLTEHHTAGAMSRQLPFLAELQPELFVEVSPELARERGLEHMGIAHVVTSRSAVEARVMVTDRMGPLRIGDTTVHQIWMPYHWGSTGLVRGDVVNDLFGVVEDPNVFIQETKVITCDVRPGPRPRGAELTALLEEVRSLAGITPATNTELVHDGAPHLDPTARPDDRPPGVPGIGTPLEEAP
ncbi:Formate dehydrogenase O alpha subunit, selenocysteine-containing [Pseudonocardia sp. Ae707_Ps1]|nr:Formate dehydrogenase O alpha subunit, selenocysteine-containing [Pseudonocardia sp. Ae707_Ps1]